VSDYDTTGTPPADPYPVSPGPIDPGSGTDNMPATSAPSRPRTPRLALLAFLVSAISLGISTTALLRSPAETEPSAAGTVRTCPSTSATDSTDPMSTADPTARSSSGTGNTLGPSALPEPTANYQLVYEGQTLTLRPGGGCNRSRSVDLDEPAIGAANEARDFQYYWSCNKGVPASLRFSDARLASVRGRDATPQDCATAIRTAPVNTNVTPSQDLVLCAVTNGTGAPDEPNRTKIALVVVNTVGADSSLVLTVKAWETPH
jgi:hypothetical protein